MEQTTLAANSSSAASACAPLLTFASLIVSTISARIQADRQAQAARAGPAEEYDFIIVGGGAAGSVLGARLSEHPGWNVLVLERGGSEPSEAYVTGYGDINLSSDITQNIQAVAQPHNCGGSGCMAQVGRVLGGGTVINEMLFVRGNHEDYNSWAQEVGDDGWKYENVLPYFKLLEDNLDPEEAADTEYHGTSGPLPVSRLPYISPEEKALMQGYDDIGLPRVDVNAASQLGYMVSQAQAADGERWSTARAYLEPVRNRSNLEVRTFAQATRILFAEAAAATSSDAQQPRATGVEYRDVNGVLRRVSARKEVLVSAGALNTPQLLMLSGLGPANHLEEAGIEVVADLPVGDNLQDHVLILGLEVYCPNCTSSWLDRVSDLQEYYASTPPEQSRAGPLASRGVNLISFVHSNLTDLPAAVPDLQYMLLGINQGAGGERCLPMDGWRYNTISLCATLLHPRSAGTVRLNLTAPEDAPVVTLNYLAEEEDLRTLVHGLHLATEYAEALEARGFYTLNRTRQEGCTDSDFGTDAYFECLARTQTHTVWHYSGTAKMGRADDSTAVVDSELRVLGVQGLRVVDTSVMPHLTSGNIMAPIIMIAERASDLIWNAHASDDLGPNMCPRVRRRV